MSLFKPRLQLRVSRLIGAKVNAGYVKDALQALITLHDLPGEDASMIREYHEHQLYVRLNELVEECGFKLVKNNGPKEAEDAE